MKEKQVEMKVVLADAHALLPGDKRKASAQFQQDALDLAQNGALEVALAVGSRESQQIEKVRIAKDDVGGHVSVAQLREL